MYLHFKKAGVIHKLVQSKLKEFLTTKKEFTSLEITEFIEEEIKKLTKTSIGYPVGFPVGININDVAAHFTPDINNNPIIKEDDVVKIDFGVNIEGCISDGAFSWCSSGKYNSLIKIAEEATRTGIKHSGVDSCLGDIGYFIEEVIESKEILIDNKIYPIKSITDLSGHSIRPFHIHGGKYVPNGKWNYNERMLEDEVYAIETFPTTGNKKIKELKEVNHFMIEQSCKENSVFYEKFNTLPFCQRWIDSTIPNHKSIKRYPVLINNGIVAQYEKSIYIKSNSVEILN